MLFYIKTKKDFFMRIWVVFSSLITLHTWYPISWKQGIGLHVVVLQDGEQNDDEDRLLQPDDNVEGEQLPTYDFS